ncbi:DNA-3-methyladenine glycosylase 2 family protein [Cellulomonas sp. zg-Y338]|uniref:DNA-3-methyladenine glycosylase II n=2 Tax=Cellulomonas chengniuliangii TaxID=2968084 RepID=A0ABY5L8L9_9CELL|nr:DNA-3-methyladenine glycosylase 2 family protein [Cellulomonas chengniuliangii]MCC2308331.1 DNA-3-methyladenine glycosylase 2 family protein [Cellulomonas chengniuliangii]MCC2317339.1 DNA-3-methyladenine glycosylase 2 family protein [Cellulomonas chengniuliangii]UUI76943.1 DNA-3-methyladenine glycosylase 2 family protein [Cellulomonas chengniuliangii]
MLLELAEAVDVRLTLAPLSRGRFDPTFQRTADGAVWRTTRMPAGPATCRIAQVSPCHVQVDAWGPGASQALAATPDLLGARDDLSGFAPRHELVRTAHRRHPGLRLTRTGRVLEALVPAVLEQRVILRTAHDAWRWLLARHGEEAPGPAPQGMRVVPDARGWLAIPSWDFHRAGVDPRRARTVRECASVAARLEEASALEPALARARLRLVPGVGVWTAAETAQRALGDPDAVSVGDYHLADHVGWALAGKRVDDERMLELLEPFRPHRQRVVRLLLLSGAAHAPRRGPRLAVQDHRGN